VFLTDKVLPYFGIKRVRISWDRSKKKWPDIWCYPDEIPPRIVVTKEWLKQTTDERRKRLVHEMGHVIGLEHGNLHGLRYSTYPGRDFWSRAVYADIVVGSKKFDAWRFC